MRFLNRDDAYNDAIVRSPVQGTSRGTRSRVVHRQAEQSRAHRISTPRWSANPRAQTCSNQKELIDRLFAVLDALSNAAFAVAVVQAVGATPGDREHGSGRRLHPAHRRSASCGWWAPPAGTPSCRSCWRRCWPRPSVVVIDHRPDHRAGAVPGTLNQFLPSEPDRADRLRRHPLHPPIAVLRRRRYGRVTGYVTLRLYVRR